MQSPISKFGDKTVDYLHLLAGGSTVAVDDHMFNFLELAGIPINRNYDLAKRIVMETAQILGVDNEHLDHSIWRYMSGGNTSRCK